MKFKYMMLLALIVSLSACSNNKDTNDNEDGSLETIDSCMYAFDNSTTILEWTAYKFTEMAGVSGKFDRVEATTQTEKAGSVAELMEGMEFTVDAASINSENPERDPKVVKFFFGAMVDSLIMGKIKNVVFNGNKGKCEVQLTMNGQSSSVLGEILMTDLQVTLNTVLNMNAWNAQSAVASLNEQCKELHTGKDGISILWPDISIKVSSTLKSFNCDQSPQVTN